MQIVSILLYEYRCLTWHLNLRWTNSSIHENCVLVAGNSNSQWLHTLHNSHFRISSLATVCPLAHCDPRFAMNLCQCQSYLQHDNIRFSSLCFEHRHTVRAYVYKSWIVRRTYDKVEAMGSIIVAPAARKCCWNIEVFNGRILLLVSTNLSLRHTFHCKP